MPDCIQKAKLRNLIKDHEIRRLQASIAETANGWQLKLERGTAAELVEYHPTAGEAHRALLERNQILADAGVSSIMVLTWEATTRIGRMVIAAMSGNTNNT